MAEFVRIKDAFGIEHLLNLDHVVRISKMLPEQDAQTRIRIIMSDSEKKLPGSETGVIYLANEGELLNLITRLKIAPSSI